jgi:hypothetical protein
VQVESLGELKKYFTSSGVEPATFWIVAQCLNHHATARPNNNNNNNNNEITAF